ncbi:MAG: hypothetical protein Terrestrivirus2_101 [Terrestrivirus sp.]|uniref:Uncharacterized protein n=1 Tax=Terrestrivirus sp. TaxID=2487775 RepID=A0A3G4ZPQ8_9VIRU|nr:MAG: hypothetical protein Terrestrivirus2_101 [Terrestrivirus sp.]
MTQPINIINIDNITMNGVASCTLFKDMLSCDCGVKVVPNGSKIDIESKPELVTENSISYKTYTKNGTISTSITMYNGIGLWKLFKNTVFGSEKSSDIKTDGEEYIKQHKFDNTKIKLNNVSINGTSELVTTDDLIDENNCIIDIFGVSKLVINRSQENIFFKNMRLSLNGISKASLYGLHIGILNGNVNGISTLNIAKCKIISPYFNVEGLSKINY